MRDIDRGDPERALQPLDLGAHVDAQLRIEIRQRLVEQQHARANHDGARQRDTLLLSTGKLTRKTALETAESHEREHLGDPRANFVRILAADA